VNQTDADLIWPDSAAGPALAASDVHVWSATLTVPPEIQTALSATLAPDELERAARFRFDHHRNRFIAGRGFLRLILSRYLDEKPARLAFDYASLGKPSLSGPFTDSELHFNLAHSDDAALFAVTRIGPVGVDVERVRPMKDAAELVARFFSPRESAAFQRVALEERPQAFFNLWTRKEAMLKASGEGITGSLNRVEISFLSGDPARVIAIGGDVTEAAAWQLHALTPRPGVVGAVAIRSAEVTVRFGVVT
jgi:4'-phosphopantetheinyl transferase